MSIHKEGRVLLVILFILLLAINFLIHRLFPAQNDLHWILGIGSAIVFVLVLQFFRNPVIKIFNDEKHVLAPADGKVVAIEQTQEKEYFKGEKKQISIFMSPLNVHVNRNPISGMVKYFKYHAGKYLVAWHPKSSTDNERTTIVIGPPHGSEVMIRQIAGAVARRIKYYIKEGDVVNQGEEFGFIKFGSRVDVLLPLDTEVTVKVGDKTRAGKTIIAKLP